MCFNECIETLCGFVLALHPARKFRTISDLWEGATFREGTRYCIYIYIIYIPWASEPDKNVGFTSKPEVSKENPRFSKFMKFND